MQSIIHPANGTCGISKCNGWVHILLGRNCMHSLQSVGMLVYISPHTNPPKTVSDHVDHSADALVSFGTVEFYNDNGC